MAAEANDAAAVRFPPPLVYLAAVIIGALISTGVYRITRNPMYVGMALLQTGIGIGFANGWIISLVPPVLAIIYATAIRPEEAYLERKFGDPYTEYKRSVRRWL